MNSKREKLIELIGRTPCVGFSSRIAAEHIADNLIENCVTIPEWISVNDRLPKNDGTKVIVTNGVYSWEDFLGVNDIWVVQYNSSLKKHKKPVTHWMKMPEPPKGD